MNAKRLSKRIAVKEWLKAQHSLLELYECLTPAQRKELRDMFIKNKYETTETK